VPELPDVEVYVRRLRERTQGQKLEKVRLASPFVVRSFDPPIRAAEGSTVRDVTRIGKRIVFALDAGAPEPLYLVIHLMIAGRFRWHARGQKIPGKLGLAAFDFASGTLILTEASTKKRASVNLVRGKAALAQFDMGGLDVLGADRAAFHAALVRESHTVKRALTDPRLFDGIGNAYSDEILHRARLSPVRLTRKLTEDEVARLHEATRATLTEWTQKLDAESVSSFPEKVTAFRPDMAVHGKFKQPCPVCGAPVQRIVHAENESNYCARCQTGGKLLADRALSRLLKADWPRTLEELEEARASRGLAPADEREDD
jgi:formamidopyrimidine-DNA glycosylase